MYVVRVHQTPTGIVTKVLLGQAQIAFFDSAFVSSFRRGEETKQKNRKDLWAKGVQDDGRSESARASTNEDSTVEGCDQDSNVSFENDTESTSSQEEEEEEEGEEITRRRGKADEAVTRQHRADTTCCFLHDNQWQQHTILERKRTTRREQKTSWNKHKHARGNADEDFITTTALRQQ